MKNKELDNLLISGRDSKGLGSGRACSSTGGGLTSSSSNKVAAEGMLSCGVKCQYIQ